MTEDEMVGWHHHLNGHEFEQALGDEEGHGSLACCSPWGHEELDTTEQLKNNNTKESDVISGEGCQLWLKEEYDFFQLEQGKGKCHHVDETL